MKKILSFDGELTTGDLLDFEHGSIFAKGIGLIEHPWFNDAKVNLEPDGRSVQVKWVAVKGHGEYDWAIYHSLDANLEKADYLDGVSHLENEWQVIANVGAKLYDERVLQKFVPCSEKAFNHYRF